MLTCFRLLTSTAPLRIKVHIPVQMYHAQEKKVLYFYFYFLIVLKYSWFTVLC